MSWPVLNGHQPPSHSLEPTGSHPVTSKTYNPSELQNNEPSRPKYPWPGLLTDTAPQFGFGQSNPTYDLTAHDGQHYVLRKKPPGQLLSKTAHQVEREYRVIHALEATDVPVPKTYCLCEDTGVIGTPFYIMEFLDGRIFEDASLPDVTADERHEMPSGFYDRQLKTLGYISASQAQAVDIETHEAVGKIPHFIDMVDFFGDPNTQPKERATLIHGDYKIDNLVYHRTEPRIIGILDWEMSTIGHPLSDLSNLLSPFTFALQSPTQALSSRINTAFFPSAGTPGLPSRSECIELYAKIADWDPSPESGWGDAFGVFRNSVIMQGIAARYALRQASSARAKEYAVQMKPFGEFAWGLVEKVKQPISEKSSKL
ncbi:MAG: hypothetical protein Q9169_001666 [Polycauliona sp. 2 TL-2023]